MSSQLSRSTSNNEPLPFKERFLLFEEPKTKWLRLQRLLKQRPAISGGLKFSLENGDDHVQRLLNVLLAFEEARRFEKKAFETLAGDGLVERVSETEIFYWRHLTGADTEKCLWLAAAYNIVPEWRNLDDLPGGMSELIEDCLSWLQEDFSTNCFLGLSREQFREAFTKDHWLSLLKRFRATIAQKRASLPANFLPDVLVLVEGPTDNLLLPCFARSVGIDLSSFGIMLIPAGGAKKIVRRYGLLKDLVKFPIFCVFDGDAQNESDIIRTSLRSSDRLHVLADGEIEDVLNLDSFVNHLNNYFLSLTNTSYYQTVSPLDFDGVSGRGEQLERFWRDRKLGRFDKLHFARFLAEVLSNQDEISPDGKALIDSLVRLRNLSK